MDALQTLCHWGSITYPFISVNLIPTRFRNLHIPIIKQHALRIHNLHIPATKQRHVQEGLLIVSRSNACYKNRINEKLETLHCAVITGKCLATYINDKREDENINCQVFTHIYSALSSIIPTPFRHVVCADRTLLVMSANCVVLSSVIEWTRICSLICLHSCWNEQTYKHFF